MAPAAGPAGGGGADAVAGGCAGEAERAADADQLLLAGAAGADVQDEQLARRRPTLVRVDAFGADPLRADEGGAGDRVGRVHGDACARWGWRRRRRSGRA